MVKFYAMYVGIVASWAVTLAGVVIVLVELLGECFR
jgi:hypothetical protein